MHRIVVKPEIHRAVIQADIEFRHAGHSAAPHPVDVSNNARIEAPIP